MEVTELQKIEAGLLKLMSEKVKIDKAIEQHQVLIQGYKIGEKEANAAHEAEKTQTDEE